MPTIIVGCSIELYRMSNLHTIMDLTFLLRFRLFIFLILYRLTLYFCCIIFDLVIVRSTHDIFLSILIYGGNSDGKV